MEDYRVIRPQAKVIFSFQLEELVFCCTFTLKNRSCLMVEFVIFDARPFFPYIFRLFFLFYLALMKYTHFDEREMNLKRQRDTTKIHLEKIDTRCFKTKDSSSRGESLSPINILLDTVDFQWCCLWIHFRNKTSTFGMVFLVSPSAFFLLEISIN